MNRINRQLNVGQRPSESPFDVRGGRAMLSLGPLSPKAYCAYRCPFCYVGGEFLSYATLSPEEIIRWLSSRPEPINVVYVSCDTESFWPPRRAARAVDLLEMLATLGIDVLFTTRAILPVKLRDRLSAVAVSLESQGHMLIGCVSVLQLTVPNLEPAPIRTPHARLDQLRDFHERGLRSVLALRPFLPAVPIEDYLRIIEISHTYADVVLGGVWYADETGEMMAATGVEGAETSDAPYIRGPMDFDNNNATWRIYESREVEAEVRERCVDLGVPFFMRSTPAIDWLRAQHSPRIDGLPPKSMPEHL